MLKKISQISLVLASASMVLTACGRSDTLNQTLALAPTPTSGQASWSGSSGQQSYLAPTAQVQTSGSAQAVTGGRAVATPNGYVYEQNPTTNAAGYSFYNANNPCLFPRPGQQVNCNGNTPVYNQPQAGMQTGYGQTTLPQTSYPTAAVNGSYGTAPATYGASNPYAVGTATSNPYATGVATNPYATGTTTSNPYATGTANTNPYAAGTPAVNPYATGTSSSPYGSTVPQSTVTASSADKAASRIDTRPSSSNQKKGVSF